MRQHVSADSYQPRSRVILLSEPTGSEKGVLLIKYSASVPVFRAIFDLRELGKKYVVVLEPSYSGALEPQLLCMLGQGVQVIVESGEPVDYRFFDRTGEFLPVSVAANHWVDRRVFYPRPVEVKDYDLILVSIWSDHKRHYSLFRALRNIRHKRKFRIALVGLPIDRDMAYIRRMARHYGVLDQLEFFEGVGQDVINDLLSRSKASILLSRKEGFNKACIEAMFADVPSYLLEGHNFGYQYDHINEQTGGFVDMNKLDEFLLEIDSKVSDSRLSPAAWVREHMSPERSTQKIIGKLAILEQQAGVAINKNLAVKVNSPECTYFDKSDEDRLAPYCRQLPKYFRPDPLRP